MSDDPATSILRAMSRMWGKSYFPDAPENQCADFKAGYERGLQGEPDVACGGITDEWKRRGQPLRVDDSFENWKRGYWSGRYTKASQLESRVPAPPGS